MDRLSPLATPSATREVLERHGLYTKYVLGQNFLVNDDVVRKIIELADVGSSDFILEVGPGIGTLTTALLIKAHQVVSIEMDNDLPSVLADTLEPWRNRFALIEKDALHVTEADIEHAARELTVKAHLPKVLDNASFPNKLVSNLPYAVAATVVLDYFQNFHFLDSATVMVQKEVADRMMAKPGSKTYGSYTVKLGLYAKAAGRFPVSPGNFFPPPRVESAVIRLDRVAIRDVDGHALSPQQVKATCTMADAAFANRRKTLANSCKAYFAGNESIAPHVTEILAAAGVDPRRRGETLTQEEFIRLGLSLQDQTDILRG